MTSKEATGEAEREIKGYKKKRVSVACDNINWNNICNYSIYLREAYT